MKKFRLNTKFLATEGIPELLTVAMIPLTLLAYFCEWVHGFIDTTLCAVVFLLCVWSTGYREWEEVKNKISKLHYVICAFCFLFMIALGTKLYSMTDATSSSKLFILAITMVPCLIIGSGYTNSIRRAEESEDKDREHHIAVAEYHAFWIIAMFIILYAICLGIIYFWGDTLNNLLGITRLESWQAAMHNLLN